MTPWSHASLGDSRHVVEPHHDSTGHWVCYVCREPVLLDGAKVVMAAVPAFDVFAAPQTTDADQPGLQVEGS